METALGSYKLVNGNRHGSPMWEDGAHLSELHGIAAALSEETEQEGRTCKALKGNRVHGGAAKFSQAEARDACN